MNKVTIKVTAAVLAGVATGSAWFLSTPDRRSVRVTDRFSHVEKQNPVTLHPAGDAAELGTSSSSPHQSQDVAGGSSARGASAFVRPSPSGEDGTSSAATERAPISVAANSTSTSRAVLGGGEVPGNQMQFALSAEAQRSQAFEFTLQLPPGVREPALMFDPAENFTDQQAEAIADLADRFVDRVEDAAKRGTEDDIGETWERAQEEVDSYYRNIFGEASYHHVTMDAAIADLARSSNP